MNIKNKLDNSVQAGNFPLQVCIHKPVLNFLPFSNRKDPASMAAAQIVNSKINKGRGTDKVIILSRNIDQYEMFCMSSILGALAFDSCLTSDGRLK